MAVTRERIVRILRTEQGIAVASTQEQLFETGLLDSLSFVDLLFNLELEFSISIDFEEIDFDAFGSVDEIAAFIDQRAVVAPASSRPS